MEKLKMHSTNAVNSNIDALEQLFPDCITESIDENGQTVKAVDFDKLKASLSYKVVEGSDERYNFTWPQKSDAIRLANSRTSMTLRPCREESVDFDKTGNLYIEGDNLDVLKVLRNTYRSRVKMIYIDPPYNTGNDFVYEDDFTIDADDYLLMSHQRDEQGNRLVKNTDNNGRFHTDWLNMIYPRLKVARDLLRDDGVIFISIDDNESQTLRMICDEVFGIENLVAQIPWQSRTSKQNDTDFSINHEYILAYAKKRRRKNRRLKENNSTEWHKSDSFVCKPIPLDKTIFSNPDNDPRGPWKTNPFDAPNERKNLTYLITNPNTGEQFLPPSGRHWSTDHKNFIRYLNDGRILFGKSGTGRPQLKVFYEEKKEFGSIDDSWFSGELVGTTTEGTKELMKIMGHKVFDMPKPTSLLKKLLTLANTKDDDIILDFFSGSATTAHAVIELNSIEGFNRKFIMVQIPAAIDEDSLSFKAGYKTICEIGKERIRKAGAQIKSEFGDQAKDLDVGFRVLKLDSSNMEDTFYIPNHVNRNSLVSDNIKQDRSSEDLLFQTMLETDVLLNSSIIVEHINNKEVFIVRDGYLIACFDEYIDLATVKAIAERKPVYFITRDGSMARDDVADNMEQIFLAISPNTTIKVL